MPKQTQEAEVPLEQDVPVYPPLRSVPAPPSQSLNIPAQSAPSPTDPRSPYTRITSDSTSAYPEQPLLSTVPAPPALAINDQHGHEILSEEEGGK